MVPETALLGFPQPDARIDKASNAAPQKQVSIFIGENKSIASRTGTTFLQTSAMPVEQLGMAGYSGTPLAQKLGIKPDITVIVMNEPASYRTLLGQMAKGVTFSDRVGSGCGFIHFFTTRRSELENQLKKLRSKIADTGVLWVSWPKKSAGVPTGCDRGRYWGRCVASWICRCKSLRG